jgi:hypothetical protein
MLEIGDQLVPGPKAKKDRLHEDMAQPMPQLLNPTGQLVSDAGGAMHRRGVDVHHSKCTRSFVSSVRVVLDWAPGPVEERSDKHTNPRHYHLSGSATFCKKLRFSPGRKNLAYSSPGSICICNRTNSAQCDFTVPPPIDHRDRSDGG